MKRIFNWTLLLFATSIIEGKPQVQSPPSPSADRVVFPAACAEVKSFISKTYTDGFPVAKAIAFKALPCALSTLEDMLPTEVNHRVNVVLALGVLGNRSTVSKLTNFLEAKEHLKHLPHPLYISKTSVLLALGYLVNQTTDDVAKTTALNYLDAGLDPSIWGSRIHWQAHGNSNSRVRDLYLTTKAMQALAVSGDPDARTRLDCYRVVLEGAREALVKHKLISNDVPMGWRTPDVTVKQLKTFEDLLVDCVRINDVVANKGLVEYYR